jgi:phosphoribosyl 1,2-cyclic phosphodiesterase
MRVCTLASGSSGNATYIESAGAKILIDAGISARRIRESLGELGVFAPSLDALLITHEHHDHVSEAGIVSIALDCPIYTTERTLSGFWQTLSGHEKIRHFRPEERFLIQDLCILPFRVFHDALDPCGFIIEERALFREHARRVGIATDLGTATSPIIAHLRECDLLILEANHDLEMLLNGGYPWHLKQRIRSEVGHLSNGSAGDVIAACAAHGRLRKAILAHLSESNNHPQKALQTVRERLNGFADQIELHVAPRDGMGKLIDV